MGKAKNIVLKPISSRDANTLVKRVHYSGKVVQNSQLHIGVFYQGRLEGAMQFGSPLDKRKVLPLVEGTQWHNMMELNRMAFSDALPRNSESRAISIAMRLIKKHAPQVKWVLSFADGTQCGDGTIYRASGFVLSAIKENGQLFRLPRYQDLDTEYCKRNGLLEGEIEVIRHWIMEITPLNAQFAVAHKLSIQDRPNKMSLEGGVRPSLTLSKVKNIMRRLTNGKTSADTLFKAIGAHPAKGYQLRYIYFIDKSWRKRLTVDELPYSEIERIGAGMYKGEKR